MPRPKAKAKKIPKKNKTICPFADPKCKICQLPFKDLQRVHDLKFVEKKTVKCGLVGAGFASGFHYEAIRKVSDTFGDVVGVYDVSAEAALKFAEKRDIKAFSTLEALIDASDVIHVCTPVWVHEEICIAGLKANKHVICEKPLTGYCGDGSPDFNGDTFPKQDAQ